MPWPGLPHDFRVTDFDPPTITMFDEHGSARLGFVNAIFFASRPNDHAR
jgi:hypothetical protein